MKYFASTFISILATFSLGFPEFVCAEQQSATPGSVIATNNANRPVRLDNVASQNNTAEGVHSIREVEILLYQGQTVTVKAQEPSARFGFSEQNAKGTGVEVSYTSGAQGTYDVVVGPVGGGFPLVVEVIPLSSRPSPECHALVWFPGQGQSQRATCTDRTPLRIFIREQYVS